MPMIRLRTSSGIGGRPRQGRRPKADQWRRTSSRCQRRTVAGVNSKRPTGSLRPRAARSKRSVGSRSGRLTRRRRMATSCQGQSDAVDEVFAPHRLQQPAGAMLHDGRLAGALDLRHMPNRVASGPAICESTDHQPRDAAPMRVRFGRGRPRPPRPGRRAARSPRRNARRSLAVVASASG
jgi:hypothetical protein